jgi:predicted AlkP superfamily phosphohydrolase/phosphomutase
MPSPVKVLFLAMDAGDTHLIQRWIAEGILPNLRSLLAESLVGKTMSLEGFYEGSTWPSFYTSVSPAHHGFHSLTQLNVGTYELYRSYPDKVINRQPFWHYLSEAGKNVAILDIPLAGITPELQGIQMVEWATHDGVYGFTTWPAELKAEVLSRFGSHPVERYCDSYGRTLQDFQSFKDQLIKGVRKKAELTIYYLMKGGWDFFAQVFSESHCVGHQCWHLHNSEHSGYDPELASQIGDPIRDVYREIDGAIGKILAHVEKDTSIIFLASHGMSHGFGGNFLLDNILERLKYLKKFPHGQSPSHFETIKDLLRRNWRKMPAIMRTMSQSSLRDLSNLILHRIKGVEPLPFELVPLPDYIRSIDFHHSKCFPIPNGNAVSGIRINLVGREPKGIIKQGPEMDELCTALTNDLLSIRNMKNGKALIKAITLTSMLYKGEYSDLLPDLLIEWDDETPLGSILVGDLEGSQLRLFSEKVGVVEGNNTYCRTGDHRPEGLFMAYGPGINAGQITRTVSIMDFGPTFLRLFGLTMPGADGSPIPEILGRLR